MIIAWNYTPIMGTTTELYRLANYYLCFAFSEDRNKLLVNLVDFSSYGLFYMQILSCMDVFTERCLGHVLILIWGYESMKTVGTWMPFISVNLYQGM